ncbi:MAG: TRAP transporter large permease subunit, partial [Saccharospirillum sp.]
MLTGMNRITHGLRSLINTLLLVSVVVWILDLPASFGFYLYNEQFLALAAGLGTASVLLGTGSRYGPVGQWLNLAFTALVLVLFGYVARHFPSLQLDVAAAPPAAAALGTVMVLAILEAVRRKTGLFLPILVTFLVVFAFIGPYLPADYQTRPVSFSRVAVYLSLDTNALLSTVLAIASIVVAPFILFGFLLNTFGGSAVFSRFASKMVGHYTGGPAKVSVIGSGAFGMVSGSAVANVVAVGSVTIPTMVRAGYSRPVAAAVEAVSSTGGQLVPPIMGASAFLMAELLEIQYQTVAIAAIVPSILFYLAVLLSVDFEARRLNIKGDKDIDLDLGDVASDGTPAPKQAFPGRYLLAAVY